METVVSSLAILFLACGVVALMGTFVAVAYLIIGTPILHLLSWVKGRFGRAKKKGF